MIEPYLLYIYIGFFIGAIVFSVLINSLFLKFSKTLGAHNITDETIIRWGSTSKPALGGISFYIIFLFSISCYSILIDSHNFVLNTQFLGLLVAVTLGFLMGLADDAYNTQPMLKLTVQLSCATILILTGTYIKLFHSVELNCLLSILWVIGMMNSINMLDNMDAITASVSKGIILCALAFLIIDGDFRNEHFIILIGVLGALVGFMCFNWHPSKMYMGDTGSQFLGVFLAAIGITYFWNSPDSLISQPDSALFFKRCLLAIMAFILPLTDTLTVVINRLRQKKSPFVGGKDHTTHALARLGLSDRNVAFVFIAVSLLSSFLAVCVYKVEQWKTIHTIGFGLYMVIVFFAFNYPTHLKKKKA